MASNSKKVYSENIEHLMIASDCVELVNLFNNCKENSTVLLSIIPIVSFVIYEINQYIVKKYNLYPFSRNDFWETVQNARHYFKFVASYNKYNVKELIRISEKQFIENHPNPIGKLFQTDLGIYLYKKAAYYDTHMVYFHLGIENKDQVDKQYFFNFGRYLGESLAKLYKMLSIKIPDIKNEITIQENNDFSYEDVKSRKYYHSIFTKQENQQINCSLNYILTNVYNLLHVLPLFMDQESPFMLKIKYLCLYHFSSYLQRLKNYHYRNLSKHTKDRFVDLESALKQIKLIRNQDLRNVLMHYALSGGIPASDNPSYYDVYKYYLPNFSAGELNIQIHRGFTDIFTILKMWKQNKSV